MTPEKDDKPEAGTPRTGDGTPDQPVPAEKSRKPLPAGWKSDIPDPENPLAPPRKVERKPLTFRRVQADSPVPDEGKPGQQPRDSGKIDRPAGGKGEAGGTEAEISGRKDAEASGGGKAGGGSETLGVTLEEGEGTSGGIRAERTESGRRSGKGRARKRKPPVIGGLLLKLRAIRVPFHPILGGSILLIGLFSWGFFKLGSWMGWSAADEVATRERFTIPPDVADEVDASLILLRKGQIADALEGLQRIDEKEKNYPSISYLLAVAAMHNGNIKLAEEKVRESIAKRERVSDALAIQAVLESMKRSDRDRIALGDPRVKSENYLRQAIQADPANGAPYFELATLLRYAGKREEARKYYRAAQARLNPVDSHELLDITLAIMALQDLPKDRLPTEIPQSDSLRKLFPAAYSAMLREDFTTAASLLAKCHEVANPDLLAYLLNDPSIRRYRDREELKGIFR